MSHYWLLITFSWFGAVRLQYISSGGPGVDSVMDPLDPNLHYPLPFLNPYNLPTTRNDFETYQNEGQTSDNYNQFYPRELDEQTLDLQRKRRTVNNANEDPERRWMPNLVDTDKTMYLQNDANGVRSPFLVQGISGGVEVNDTDLNMISPMDKKSFSPWGGKRDPNMEHMWTWKRAANIREPSMPKRVRFSPWGGKRSGQLVYKPGSKATKLIFSASLPELTRVVSNYSPSGNRLNLAGFKLIPSLDKRHPIRFLALSTKFERAGREALPFNAFLESLPKMYKPGHPYVDVNLKKDGKRKVKFSAWGGKRSPPIIGPIWTPSSQNVKDTTLDAILLIRNNQDNDGKTTKAF